MIDLGLCEGDRVRSVKHKGKHDVLVGDTGVVVGAWLSPKPQILWDRTGRLSLIHRKWIIWV
jgi:hypothetical protein